jgi:hypothetical protein
MRPLFDEDGQLPSLPNALRQWCLFEGVCQRPMAITTVGFRVAATFAIDGVERSTLFRSGSFEGQASVAGLPLRFRRDHSFADTVPCPTEDVVDEAYADVDGDGYEELVLVTEEDRGWYVVVCGTSLVVEPYGYIDPSGAGQERVDATDIDLDGRDELILTRFNEAQAQLNGGVVVLDGNRPVATGQMLSQRPPAAIGEEGTSFACVDEPDGSRRFLSFTYRYIGGTDLSNSTSMEYTGIERRGDVQIGEPMTGSFTLPAELDAAFHIVGAYCGPLPILTG